jgi:hypothetical protein
VPRLGTTRELGVEVLFFCFSQWYLDIGAVRGDVVREIALRQGKLVNVYFYPPKSMARCGTGVETIVCMSRREKDALQDAGPY